MGITYAPAKYTINIHTLKKFLLHFLYFLFSLMCTRSDSRLSQIRSRPCRTKKRRYIYIYICNDIACKFAIPIRVSILGGEGKIESKRKGRVSSKRPYVKMNELLFSLFRPANSTDHRGVNPRFEYA